LLSGSGNRLVQRRDLVAAQGVRPTLKEPLLLQEVTPVVVAARTPLT
jgi:hypothetical protein